MNTGDLRRTVLTCCSPTMATVIVPALAEVREGLDQRIVITCGKSHD